MELLHSLLYNSDMDKTYTITEVARLLRNRIAPKGSHPQRHADPTGKLRLSDTKPHPLALCWRLRGRKNRGITKDHTIYSRTT